jgi:hypothetical protein
MTEELQRIKIAEACGWTDFTSGTHEGATLYGRKPLSCSNSWEVPYYLNDLNAMHEAEKILTDNQLVDFAEWLGADFSEHPTKTVRYLRATAPQRAAAFLRTLGLWEENS